MKQLVEVYRGQVFCDSQMVAEKFGYKHLHVMKVIKKLVDEFSEIKGSLQEPLNFEEIEREYRGQKFKAYIMVDSHYQINGVSGVVKEVTMTHVKLMDVEKVECDGKLSKVLHVHRIPMSQVAESAITLSTRQDIEATENTG